MDYANFSKKFSETSAINMLPFDKKTKAIN